MAQVYKQGDQVIYQVPVEPIRYEGGVVVREPVAGVVKHFVDAENVMVALETEPRRELRINMASPFLTNAMPVPSGAPPDNKPSEGPFVPPATPPPVPPANDPVKDAIDAEPKAEPRKTGKPVKKRKPH